MSEEEEGFASRWSRRKIETQKSSTKLGEKGDVVVLDGTEELEAVSATAQEGEVDKTTDDGLLSEEDFDDVDFDALDKSADYTRFMQSNVPAAIQQKALRKLWDSDSVFEVLDGMNDYDEDFTGDGLAGKALKTAYKVGRGFIEKDTSDILDENHKLKQETITENETIKHKETKEVFETDDPEQT